MSLSENDIRIILDLLEDDDPSIVGSMRGKLLRMGEPAVSRVLETAGDRPSAHREASRVLRMLRAPSPEDRFRSIPLVTGGDLDLEQGVLAVARFGYPDVDTGACRARLDHMAAELAPNVAPNDHPIRAIRTLNDYLFDQQGFHGQNDYDRFPDPDNSYINRVLERKVGLPISLSVLYILLARRLDVAIVGVNLPMHFIVRFGGNDRTFYIDPFNRGRILTANECRDMVGRVGDRSALRDASNRAILVRTMANLMQTYTALGDSDRSETARNVIEILQDRGLGR